MKLLDQRRALRALLDNEIIETEKAGGVWEESNSMCNPLTNPNRMWRIKSFPWKEAFKEWEANKDSAIWGDEQVFKFGFIAGVKHNEQTR